MKISCDYNKMLDVVNSRFKVREEAEEYYKKRITDVSPLNIDGKEVSAYSYTDYKLENRQYFFSSFKCIQIGEHVALDEDDYMVVVGKTINHCVFDKCKFQNIRFEKCNFTGCRFVNVNFYNTTFESCFFSQPYIGEKNRTVENIPYILTSFEKCIFLAKFSNCNLEYGYLKKCSMTLTKFLNCDMTALNMDTCALTGVEIKDCNMTDTQIYKADIMDISITDDKCTKVNEETFFDYMVYTKKINDGKLVRTESGWKADNYDDMVLDKSKTLRRVSNLFDKNGYSAIAGEYFYQSKKIENKVLHRSKKLISTGALVLCGYGERPLFTMISIIVSIMIFAVLYLVTGFSVDGMEIGWKQIVEAGTDIAQIIKYYGHSVFFSVTTFSTVGYGNYVPVGEISSFLAAIQMLVGVSLSALWTGCVFKKVAR